MITQTIKRWLNKLFGWLSGKQSPQSEYARVESLLNKGVTQESTSSRAAIDGIVPQSSVAPFIAGQGETSCSTIDEWPERVVHPPAISSEESEQPPAPATPAKPPQPPKIPPAETAKTVKDNQGEALAPAMQPMPVSTPEQKLEFLQYLVKRGIVNEGFREGQVPDQYRDRG
ncbi:MAG TPA: hypothetical protein VKP04_06825 [Ktedonobacteraceae bacterium]|nr:hypothetical protein [Ktedonobacteraceae bacterium]